MSPQDVRDRIAEIERSKDDPEMAHGAEDALRAAVLGAIADGEAEDVREMARLALTTDELQFARWYA